MSIRICGYCHSKICYYITSAAAYSPWCAGCYKTLVQKSQTKANNPLCLYCNTRPRYYDEKTHAYSNHCSPCFTAINTPTPKPVKIAIQGQPQCQICPAAATFISIGTYFPGCCAGHTSLAKKQGHTGPRY